MPATTLTPGHDTTEPRIKAAVDDARKDIAATFDSLRSAAGDAGDRLPGLIDGVRDRARAGAREIDGWPDETRRVVAVASIGLGTGLALAGAPRLLFGAALLPAIVVGVTGMRRPGVRSV